MYKHYIIMSSAFSIGKRIALDYLFKDSKDINKIKKELDYINNNTKNDLHLSSHFITVDDKGWDAVVKYDRFFKNVEVIKTKEEFIKLINEDKSLSGLDVARYILSIIPCDHLKLEKLTYMAYADYYCKYNTGLFSDRIYAYKYGPVITSVYKRFKKKKTTLYAEDDTEINDKKELHMAIKSRLMSSKNGLDKVFSIEETLNKYGNLTGKELVKITHKKNTPWSIVGFDDTKPKQITQKEIKEFHKYEVI